MMNNHSTQRPYSQRQLRVGELVKQNLGELFIRNEAKIPSISTKLINDAKGKSLKECLEIEYQLSQNVVYRDDFDKGVNSVLVTKDHSPQWNPSKIEEINIEEFNKYFESHSEKLYL